MSSVAMRPLCLFLVNKHAPDAAPGLALAFVVCTLALVVSGAGAHRRFYRSYFGAGAGNGFSFYVYAASLGILTVVGALAVAAMALYFASSAVLIAAIGVYFVSEKLADEILRLRLFERDMNAWGRSSVLRNVIQALFLAAALGAAGLTPVNAWWFVAAFTVGNLAVFGSQLPAGVLAKLVVRGGRRRFALWRRAVATLRVDWLLWLIPLISALVSYLDRVVALTVEVALLPLFTLVVMCFSILPLVVDFYFSSHHRREFLERQMTVGRAMRSPRLLWSVAIGIAASVVASVIVVRVSPGGADFPFEYVIGIAALQAAASFANIPREILYWTHAVGSILRIEIWFWVLFIGGCATTWSFGGAPVGMVLTVAVAGAVVRLAWYVIAATRAVPASGEPSPAAG